MAITSCNRPYLRQRFGTQIWTLDRITELFEHPERFDYTCLISAYGGPERIPIDRSFRAGETLEWEGSPLPSTGCRGRPSLASAYAEIDGRRVAWTGDNVYASSSDSGHDAVMAQQRHPRGRLLYCAEYLCRLQPDLILAGTRPSSLTPPRSSNASAGGPTRSATHSRPSAPTRITATGFDPFWVRVSLSLV